MGDQQYAVNWRLTCQARCRRKADELEKIFLDDKSPVQFYVAVWPEIYTMHEELAHGNDK